MSRAEERDFAGYRIVRPLELGERASVWEAEDADSGARVAIETLAGEAARDEHVAEWFSEAWELVGELDEAAVVSVLSIGEQDGVPFAVRTPAGEVTLAERLERGGPLSAGAALQVLGEVGGALEAVHQAGVVHGALMPACVALDEHGRSHLAGFGRREGDRREDVRALGALLLAMLGAPGSTAANGEVATEDAEAPPASRWELERAEALRAVGAAGAAGEYGRAAELVAAARAARPESSTDRDGRAWIRPALLVAAAVAVIALIVILLAGGGGDESADGAGSRTAATTDASLPTPATGPARPIPVRGFPVAVAVSDGVVYAVTRDGGSLDGFDEATGERVLGPVALGGAATDLILLDGVAWITEADEGAVARVDPVAEQPAATAIPTGGEPGPLVAAAGSIWVVDAAGRRLLRLPPDATAATEPEAFDLDAADPDAIAFGRGSLWVGDGGGRVLRIDPDDPAEQRAFDVGGGPAAVTVAAGSVWVADADRGSVLALDPDSGATRIELAVGGEPADLAADREHLWAANADGFVTTIGLSSGAIEQIDLSGAGGRPWSIAVGEQVWVATGAGNSLVAIAAGAG